VKNWSAVFFSHDSWCGDQPLKFQFPHLFRIAQLKDATIQAVVTWNGDQNHGNITFFRSLNEWEEEDVLRLLATLANANVVLEREEKVHWPCNSCGQLTIKSYYEESFKGSSQLNFPPKAIWNSKAPLKVCFLT